MQTSKIFYKQDKQQYRCQYLIQLKCWIIYNYITFENDINFPHINHQITFNNLFDSTIYTQRSE